MRRFAPLPSGPDLDCDGAQREQSAPDESRYCAAVRQKADSESIADVRFAVVAGLPAAIAIGVFGALYGAAARPLLGPEMTVVASFIVFSGALQFATVALLAAGAAAPALLLTAVVLNLRHIVMGAVVRPWLRGSRVKRLLLAFFLLDETFGFTVAAANRVDEGPRRAAVAERTLLATGVLCYAAWIVGTVLGVVGASIPGMEGFAGAVFPVLFIGLAALAARTRSVAFRAAVAAAITAVICLTLPEIRALAPVVAGAVVALPADRPRNPEARP
jgi:predicted branched-subunit amino acid permease